jgi:hypothetical protein
MLRIAPFLPKKVIVDRLPMLLAEFVPGIFQIIPMVALPMVLLPLGP